MPNALDPTDRPSLLDQARTEYPVLNKYDLGYKESPGRSSGYLEFWPPNEPGGADLPRPQELDINKPGIEVYNRETRPIDILGDVVSHHMINEDPTIKGHYNDFVSSLEPWQQQRLQEQHRHAQQNFNEKRSYDEWAAQSGVPAYFRGHAFQQWPNSEQMYTPQQIQRFDQMMEYLRSNPDKPKLRIGRKTYG